MITQHCSKPCNDCRNIKYWMKKKNGYNCYIFFWSIIILMSHKKKSNKLCIKSQDCKHENQHTRKIVCFSRRILSKRVKSRSFTGQNISPSGQKNCQKTASAARTSPQFSKHCFSKPRSTFLSIIHQLIWHLWF